MTASEIGPWCHLSGFTGLTEAGADGEVQSSTESFSVLRSQTIGRWAHIWSVACDPSYLTHQPHERMSESPTLPTPATEPLSALSLEASLTVTDVRRSADWYRDVLGFTIDREFEREGRLLAVSLRAGAVRILVTQDDGARGTDRVKGVGFSLQITTPHDIDAIAERARRAGATLDSEPADVWGVRGFRVRDPDGFRFTVSSPRP
jgi:uncharacterized glyoxalase superfamily protein PhnB